MAFVCKTGKKDPTSDTVRKNKDCSQADRITGINGTATA